jgi:hypothetical protein
VPPGTLGERGPVFAGEREDERRKDEQEKARERNDLQRCTGQSPFAPGCPSTQHQTGREAGGEAEQLPDEPRRSERYHGSGERHHDEIGDEQREADEDQSLGDDEKRDCSPQESPPHPEIDRHAGHGCGVRRERPPPEMLGKNVQHEECEQVPGNTDDGSRYASALGASVENESHRDGDGQVQRDGAHDELRRRCHHRSGATTIVSSR